MAQYMFLLHDDESWYDDLTPDKWEARRVLGSCRGGRRPDPRR